MEKQLPKLEQLNTSFTAKNAAQVGITRYELNLLLEEGAIEKIGRGVYQKGEVELDEKTLMRATLASLGKPSCICLWSAASFYDLTDEIIDKTWAYVPYGKFSHLDSIVVVRKRNPKWEIGIEEIEEIRITTIERTIIDAMTSRRHFSRSSAFKLAKQALKNELTTLKKLQNMARDLGVLKRVESELLYLVELYD